MRTAFTALLAVILLTLSAALRVKRPGGTAPVGVELAEEGMNPAAAVASRFVELSHAAEANPEASDSRCSEEDCTLAEESSWMQKTQEQRLKKKARKLKKRIAKSRKVYLENHSEEQLAVLENQAILDALNAANEGAN